MPSKFKITRKSALKMIGRAQKFPFPKLAPCSLSILAKTLFIVLTIHYVHHHHCLHCPQLSICSSSPQIIIYSATSGYRSQGYNYCQSYSNYRRSFYSRLATRVIAHVTCLPTKLLGESGQQITLVFLPSCWISVLLLTLGPPTFQIT